MSTCHRSGRRVRSFSVLSIQVTSATFNELLTCFVGKFLTLPRLARWHRFDKQQLACCRILDVLSFVSRSWFLHPNLIVPAKLMWFSVASEAARFRFWYTVHVSHRLMELANTWLSLSVARAGGTGFQSKLSDVAFALCDFQCQVAQTCTTFWHAPNLFWQVATIQLSLSSRHPCFQEVRFFSLSGLRWACVGFLESAFLAVSFGHCAKLG